MLRAKQKFPQISKLPNEKIIQLLLDIDVITWVFVSISR